MQLDFRQIVVPPGHQVILHDVDWKEFEELLEDAGEHRATRYAYHNRELEILSPQAEHEFSKGIIASMVEIILEELDLEFIALGSTTLKNDRAEQAVEPDECFYIGHEADVRGKERLDLNLDPPPDLALEIDLTSRTHFRHYAALGIPELWRFDGKEFEILMLETDKYRSAGFSRLFPQFDLKVLAPASVRQAKQQGRNKTLKAFRQTVKDWTKANQKPKPDPFSSVC